MSDPSEPLPQERVSAMLRSQGDVTIPPEVAERLQQAIAAEARRRRAAAVVDPVPGADDAHRQRVDVARTSQRPNRGRWLLAASVAAAAALGAVLLPPLLDGGSDLLAGGGDDTADTATDATRLQPQGLDGQESAVGGGGAQSSGTGAVEAPGARTSIENLPPVPEELQRLVLDSADGAPPGYGAPPGCGETLTEAVGGAVTASADVDMAPGGVVLLVDEPSTTVVWWLPSCTSGPEQALGRSPGMPQS